MCIVVDANVVGAVLDQKAKNHSEFKPVLDWVVEGRGKFVIGGTRYLSECKKYLPLFAEFSRVKKAVAVDNQKVDAKASWADQQIVHRDFDDPHLIGLLMESGCKLICSLDARAYPFFQHSLFFSSYQRPKIYSRKTNSDLLVDDNICELCKPVKKLTVAEKKDLTILQ